MTRKVEQAFSLFVFEFAFGFAFIFCSKREKQTG